MTCVIFFFFLEADGTSLSQHEYVIEIPAVFSNKMRGDYSQHAARDGNFCRLKLADFSLFYCQLLTCPTLPPPVLSQVFLLRQFHPVLFRHYLKRIFLSRLFRISWNCSSVWEHNVNLRQFRNQCGHNVC